MTICFQNQYGLVDLSLIRDEDVALLDEPRKLAIGLVIETVMARMSADQRLAVARARVRTAMASEDETLAAHQAASPPIPFAVREANARAAAIAAYNKA